MIDFVNKLANSENRKSGLYILISIILLTIYSLAIFEQVISYEEDIFNVLFLLIITYYLSDRLITAPRNVLTNAITVLLLALTMHLNIVLIYSLVILIIGFIALVYKDETEKGGDGISKKIGKGLFEISQYLGNSKVIVSLLFFFTLEEYIVENQKDAVMWALFLYWLILLIPDLANQLIKLYKNKDQKKTGIIAYANSPYTASVYLNSESNIGVGDRIFFDTECNDS